MTSSTSNTSSGVHSNRPGPKVSPHPAATFTDIGGKVLQDQPWVRGDISPLGRCPLTAKEIQAHSKLASMDAMEEEMAADEMVAHFFGGLATSSSSGYEELRVDEAAKLWEWALAHQDADQAKADLKKIRAFTGTSSTLQGLEPGVRAQQTVKTARRYHTALHALEIGKSFLGMGGWRRPSRGSSPTEGQAFVYECKRHRDGTFDFIIYTATALQTSTRLLTGEKWRLSPQIRYEGVPAELLTHDRVQEWLENCVYGEANVGGLEEESLLRVFDPFADYRKVVPLTHEGAITGQRYAGCGPGAIKAMLRSKMGNGPDYKRLLLRTKLRVLAGGYQAMKAKGPIGPQEQTLFRQAAHNLLRTLSKAAAAKWVAAEELTEAQATVWEILHLIGSVEEAPKDPLESGSEQGGVRLIPGLSEAAPSPVAAERVVAEIDREAITKDNLEGKLHALQARLQAEDGTPGVAEARRDEIHSLIDRLPLPADSFWETIDNRKETIRLLTEVAKLYGSKQHPEVDLHSRRLASSWTLYAVVHRLTLLEHPTWADHLKTPDLTGSVVDWPMTYLDQNERERIEALRDYFAAHNGTTFSDENSRRYHSHWEDQFGNHPLWLKMLTDVGGLQEQLELIAQARDTAALREAVGSLQPAPLEQWVAAAGEEIAKQPAKRAIQRLLDLSASQTSH